MHHQACGSSDLSNVVPAKIIENPMHCSITRFVKQHLQLHIIIYNLRLLNNPLPEQMDGSVCLSVQPTSYPPHCPSIVCVGEVMVKLPLCARTHSCSPKRRMHCLCHHHDHACTQCILMSNDCIWLLGLMPIAFAFIAPLMSYLGRNSSCLSLWERMGHYHFITVSSFLNLKVKISQ